MGYFRAAPQTGPTPPISQEVLDHLSDPQLYTPPLNWNPDQGLTPWSEQYQPPLFAPGGAVSIPWKWLAIAAAAVLILRR